MQPLKDIFFTWFIMLSKYNNKKKVHRTLVPTILSLSVVSLIITTSAPDYSIAQVGDSQNATTTRGVPSATTAGMNTTSPTTTTEVRSLIEQTHIAVQNNDIRGALMNLNSALDALEDVRDGQQNTTTATPNEMTDNTATEAGTIGSGGAGGAGTAGGIMTGNETKGEAGTIGSGGAGGAGTAGGIMTGGGA
jgi:hypothetical protein